MIQVIKDYVWFIKESQSFMAGHFMPLIFVQSLGKGFTFSYKMAKDRKLRQC